MILAFDTETTGKYNFDQEANSPHQPDIVQLAAILADNDGKEMANLNLVVRTTKEIAKEASDLHGITPEINRKWGVKPAFAMSLLMEMMAKAEVVVAHNVDFDLHCVKTALQRYGCIGPIRKVGPIHGILHTDGDPAYCTMKTMTDICKIQKGFRGYKWPKLQEAYVHCFGEEFSGAHDALADVRACLKVYLWIQKHGTSNPAISTQLP